MFYGIEFSVCSYITCFLLSFMCMWGKVASFLRDISECYPWLRIKVSKGTTAFRRHTGTEIVNCPLWNAECYLYAFDRVKKASIASVCGAFWLAKERLNSLSCDCLVLCPLVSRQWYWTTNRLFYFWLRWRVHES